MFRLFAIFALTGLWGGEANAQEPSGKAQEYNFEISANGFRYGDFSVTLTDGSQSYRVDVTAQARGVFGFMLRAKYGGTSIGKFNPDGHRQGVEFKARSSRIFANRTQQVTYKDGRPMTVDIVPTSRRTLLSNPRNVSGAFNDPLSFLANIVANSGSTCPEIVSLYDGRRITKVTFGTGKSQSENLICTGTYEIIEGPDHSLQKGVRVFNLIAVYDYSSPEIFALKSVEFQSGGNVILLNRLPR